MESMRKRGFTLVELLLVIAVIGLLAGLIAVNLNRARAKSRDAKRRSDLNQIKTAVEGMYDDNRTYAVSGTGSGGGSQGLFNYDYDGTSMTLKSIAQGLIEENYLSAEPMDPIAGRNPSNPDHNGYMYYTGTGGFTQNYLIFARLEKLNDSDGDGWDDASGATCRARTDLKDTYGMNYCVNS